jgi:hypothetical protein
MSSLRQFVGAAVPPSLECIVHALAPPGPLAAQTHIFVLGADYHLGDLLWLTAVLHEYRRRTGACRIVVGHPDASLGHILGCNPDIDEVCTGIPASEPRDIVHDLRPVRLGRAMIAAWRHRLPWLYYRDLWLEPRGQWLATYLRLGTLPDYRPLLNLREEDYAAAGSLPRPYIALAPHIGAYRIPLVSRVWRTIKGWSPTNWAALASQLCDRGLTPLTLGAAGQDVIPGTVPLLGLPIRQVAAIIDRAEALVTGESGLWFVAAARATPFVIVPWWLPPSINWAEPMHVPHRLVPREEATVGHVLTALTELGV